jgi:hypothetical protein
MALEKGKAMESKGKAINWNLARSPFDFLISLREVFGESPYVHCPETVFFFDHHVNYDVYRVAQRMGVNPSEKIIGGIKYFESADKQSRGIWTHTKAGKFFRKLLPNEGDSYIESLVKAWVEKFKTPEYEIIRNQDIAATYQLPIVSRPSPNWDKWPNIKSLSGSCMRYSKGHWGYPFHPATVYESGDFEIVAVIDKDTGKLAARVLIGNESAGPIYSACDIATEKLVEYLESNGIDRDSDWFGLNLKKIHLEGEYCLMCFIDEYSYAEDSGDCFTISSVGNIDIQTTSGRTRVLTLVACDDCGLLEEESDMETAIGSSGYEICVCYSCRMHSGDYVWTQDSAYMRHIDNCIRTVEGDWHTAESIDQFVEYGGEYYPTNHHEVTLFDGKYYHEDSEELKEAIAEKKKKDEAFITSESWYIGWYEVSDYSSGGRPYNCPVYGEYSKTETRLRENYQLDENNIPYRLPELPGLELTDITPDIAGIEN